MVLGSSYNVTSPMKRIMNVTVGIVLGSSYNFAGRTKRTKLVLGMVLDSSYNYTNLGDTIGTVTVDMTCAIPDINKKT